MQRLYYTDGTYQSKIRKLGTLIVAKLVTSLALSAVLAWAAGCAVNPVTGEEELMFFPPEEDVKLGRTYAPAIEEALNGRISDENLQRYLNDVGQRIARICHRPDLAYHFTAVDDKGTNALAVPGGYIYITRGLLAELRSEAQLAAVLAHEVGHVVARDTMAAMSRRLGMTAIVAAAHVSGAPSDATRAAHFITAVLSLQYSRDDEKDADLTGLSYMVQAGYDPRGMVETMQILQDLQIIRPIEFFSTHPNPENRIAYLEERIAQRYAELGRLKRGQEDYDRAVLARLKRRNTAAKARMAETPRSR
jgi:predicted Zn-dependent protease